MTELFERRTLVLTIRAIPFEQGDLEVWATLYDATEVSESTLLSVRVLDVGDMPAQHVLTLLDLLRSESARVPRLF